MEDPLAIQHERLRQVREVENMRSSMVANLQKRNDPRRDDKEAPESPREDDIIVEQMVQQGSPKKKKHKRSLSSKKSPAKVVSKSNVKVTISIRLFLIKHGSCKHRSQSVSKTVMIIFLRWE